MPRRALKALATLLALSLAAAAAGAAASDPHLDPSLLPGGCQACHRGHGASRSPMLPQAQKALCLGCHGSRGDLDRAVRDGRLSPGARPALLGSVLAQPYAHPLSDAAFSQHEQGAVTCTSCHSPHRGALDWAAAGRGAGGQRLSPRGDGEPEFALCQGCHGSQGDRTRSLSDVSRLFSPASRSFHPVEGPARESSPSLTAGLSGTQVSCTDCHGNNDPRGPRGPHGSSEPFLLRARHPTVDGGGESQLCYECHRREAVLDSPNFPEHRLHLLKVRATCATCHSAHGSVENRALIRFGEERIVSGVSPGKTGRVAFVSNGPGSGACYLSCHGRDHDASDGYGVARDASPAPFR